MNDHHQMRGLWQSHHRITGGVTGHRRMTADRTILSCLHHGVTPTIRAFAAKLRAKHGIVSVEFSLSTEGGAP